ncbi:MAG: PIG-L family deacetylase [Bacteroidota bacterium]
MNKDRILILSPHTDDAELGCGGTISKLLQQNKEIFWVVFSTAEDSLPAELPKTALADEFVNITRFLGLKENNYKVFNFLQEKASGGGARGLMRQRLYQSAGSTTRTKVMVAMTVGTMKPISAISFVSVRGVACMNPFSQLAKTKVFAEICRAPVANLQPS